MSFMNHPRRIDHTASGNPADKYFLHFDSFFMVAAFHPVIATTCL
jgi:hypothetical protein